MHDKTGSDENVTPTISKKPETASALSAAATFLSNLADEADSLDSDQTILQHTTTLNNLTQQKRKFQQSVPEAFTYDPINKTYYQNGPIAGDQASLKPLSFGEFKCSQCTRSFPKQVALKSHMIMHSDVRIHHCDCCTKQFARKHDLLRHRRTVHKAKDLEDHGPGPSNSVAYPAKPFEYDNIERDLINLLAPMEQSRPSGPIGLGLTENVIHRPRAVYYGFETLQSPIDQLMSQLPPIPAANISQTPTNMAYTPQFQLHPQQYDRKASFSGQPLFTPSHHVKPPAKLILNVTELAYDKDLKCVHMNVAHYCRKCRTDGYWRKLELKKHEQQNQTLDSIKTTSNAMFGENLSLSVSHSGGLMSPPLSAGLMNMNANILTRSWEPSNPSNHNMPRVSEMPIPPWLK